MNLSSYDFFAANPSAGFPYEGGPNGGEALTAYFMETGRSANPGSPEYQQWAMSKVAPNTLQGFQNSPGGIRMLPNGQFEVDDKILGSNMDSGGMFDWADMIGPGALLLGPFAGMMGAFGGAGLGGAGTLGGGGAMDMGVGTQGWMDYLGSQAGGAGAGGMTWDSTINQMVDQWGNVVDQSAMPGTTPGYTSPTGITPGYSGPSGGIQDILKQLQGIPGGSQIAQMLLGQVMGGGGGGGSGAGGGAGGLNLGSLIPLLGIGSGLSTLFGDKPPAVDPAMIQALWQAGQNNYNNSLVPNTGLQTQANDVYNAGRDTYNAALDPRKALYDRTQQQLQEQTRASQSARGTAMSPYGAGIENKAMSDFNIDWTNQQLQRQIAGMGAFTQGMQAPLSANQQNLQQQQQGLQGFTNAGNVAANAGVANNAQAFLQNQTGLNNLTGPGGLGGLFGGTGANANQLGSWINSLFGGGATAGGTSTPTYDSSGSYNAGGIYQPYYTGYDASGGAAYG